MEMQPIPEIKHDIEGLEQALGERVIQIVFYKKDGTLRTARATRSPNEIPTALAPKGKRSPSELVLTFFDTDLCEWRCLRRDRLVGYIDI